MRATQDKILKRFVIQCLHRQFASVGQRYTVAKTAKPNWYAQYSWTSQEREAFKKWFVAKAREDLKLTKKGAELEFQYWNLMWGWRDEI
jgi:hypothetical protein